MTTREAHYAVVGLGIAFFAYIAAPVFGFWWNRNSGAIYLVTLAGAFIGYLAAKLRGRDSAAKK